MRRGVLRTFRGRHAARSGGDPLPVLAEAVGDLDRAVAALPRMPEFRLRRAEALLERAAWLGKRGSVDLDAAATDLRLCAAALPGNAEISGVATRLAQLRRAAR